MKWDKAMKQIEQALAAGKAVSVHYRRKYDRSACKYRYDHVESISSYPWKNEICKAVNTRTDQLDSYSHIIDEVIIKDL